MPSVRATGIVLRSVKVGEADKILTIFSRNLGKISAIAKGARKPTSKFGGRLEVFAYNDYLLGTGKSLYVVSQVETIESFYSLREDEKTLKAASFIAKLTNQCLEDCHKNIPLFELLLESLRALKEKGNPKAVQIAFEFRLMDIEGFIPYLDGCVKCKKKITKEPAKVNLNLNVGGLVCSTCSRTVVGGSIVPFKLVKQVKYLKTKPLEAIKELKINEEDLANLEKITRLYISEHIGKDIRNW